MEEGVLPRKGAEAGDQLLHQLVLYTAMHQQIVGSHTGLACVGQLAMGDAPGSQGEIGGLVYNAGAFASQFQADGDQLPGGGLHHDLAHPFTAGEKDKVKGLFQQSGAGCGVSFHHCHIFRPEAIGNEGGDGMGGGGGQFGGLEHRAVAGGNGAHQGLQAEQQGIVPGG